MCASKTWDCTIHTRHRVFWAAVVVVVPYYVFCSRARACDGCLRSWRLLNAIKFNASIGSSARLILIPISDSFCSSLSARSEHIVFSPRFTITATIPTCAI